jgi:hypothetical protein
MDSTTTVPTVCKVTLSLKKCAPDSANGLEFRHEPLRGNPDVANHVYTYILLLMKAKPTTLNQISKKKVASND